MPIKTLQSPTPTLFCRSLPLLWTCKPLLTPYFCIVGHAITVCQSYMANLFTSKTGTQKPSDMRCLAQCHRIGGRVMGGTRQLLTYNLVFFLLAYPFPIIDFLPPTPSSYAVPIYTSTFFTKLFPLSETPLLPHCSYKILEKSRTFSEQLSSQFLLIYSPMLYSFTMSTDFSVLLFTSLSPIRSRS